MSKWTLFSNHGHVLICLSRDSKARLRDVAADVGITERAVQKIVRDLQDVGMISVTKVGRRNSYRIHQKKKLRHELESNTTLKDLIKVVNKLDRAELKSKPKKVAKTKVEKIESQAVEIKRPIPPLVSGRLKKALKVEEVKKPEAKKKVEKTETPAVEIKRPIPPELSAKSQKTPEVEDVKKSEARKKAKKKKVEKTSTGVPKSDKQQGSLF